MTICWRGCPKGIPEWTICGEKLQKVTRISDKETKFEVWETQSGLLAYVVRWTMGDKLGGMNQGIATNLKKHIEGRRVS